MPVLSKTTIQK